MDLTAMFIKVIESDAIIPITAGLVIVVIVMSKSIASVLKTQARERSRREIAAYIAEGSMSPEQGEKLMKSGDRDEA